MKRIAFVCSLWVQLWIVLAAADATLLIEPTGGTVLFNDGKEWDDEISAQRPLGLTFHLFGNSEEPLTALDVSTNGNLNLSGDRTFENSEMPSEETVRISPLWDDLVGLAGSGDSVIEKAQPGVSYSVTWTAHERGNPLSRHIFQVVLIGKAVRLRNIDFQPDDIVFAYQQIGPSFSKGSATVGLDAGDGSTAVTLPAPAPPTGLVPSGAGTILPSGGALFLFRFDPESEEYSLPLTTNSGPAAQDDVAYVVNNTGRVSIPVLRNDTDPNGDALSIVEFTQGAYGTVTLNSDGTLSYQPATHFTGNDEFAYTVRDGFGATSTAQVRLMPVEAASGRYNGPFLDELSEEVGSTSLSIDKFGRFEGTLIRDSELLGSIQGTFDTAGGFTGTTVGTDEVEYALVLQLELVDGVHRITGTLSDDSEVFTLVALRSPNNPPEPTDDVFYTRSRGSVLIPVLANDRDRDGDTLSLNSFTNGIFGRVTSQPDGKLRYHPGPGFLGVDWFTYTVSDSSGLAVKASVRVVPVAATRGRYQGLVQFTDEEGYLSPESSGFLTLTISASGRLTGTMWHGGYRVLLNTQLNASGHMRVVVSRPDGVVLEIALHVDPSSEPHQIRGTVSDGTAVASVTAARPSFVVKSAPTPLAGAYTALLERDEESDLPPGCGYALITIRRNGIVALRGKLGDCTPFALRSIINTDGTLPVYLGLRNKKDSGGPLPRGSLMGTVQIGAQSDGGVCSGALSWHKPESHDGEDPGFLGIVNFTGSAYLPPEPGTRVLKLPDGLNNAILGLDDEVFLVTFTKENRVLPSEPTGNQLLMRVEPANGFFQGTFLVEGDTATTADQKPRKRVFSGVILQKQVRGGGLFRTVEGPAPVFLTDVGEGDL